MSSSYSYLKKYIPGGSDVNDNWFLPIKKQEIEQCELKMKAFFPIELKTFYREIGFGMLRSPELPPKDYRFYNYNQILPPHIAVNYMLGILENPEEDYYMSEDTYEMLEAGDLPFFEIGDSCRYLFIKLYSDNPNAVWALGNIKIEDSFEKFIWRLYYESPSFYDDIIEDYYKDK